MPSAGRQISDGITRLAVGNPSSRPAVAVLDGTAHLVRSPEQRCRAAHVASSHQPRMAVEETLAVAPRRGAIGSHELERADLEAQPCAHRAQQRDVPASPVAEVEVLAHGDHDLVSRQPTSTVATKSSAVSVARSSSKCTT
jgi:hypothetical protein